MKQDIELVKIELLSALLRWQEAGLGDYRLIEFLLKYNPSLIHNMVDVINENTDRTELDYRDFTHPGDEA